MPIRTQLIAGLIAAAVAFGAGWLVNGWRMDAKLARLESQHAAVLEQLANAAVASVQAVRAEEARRHAVVEEQRDIAQNKLDGLALDVAAGRAFSDRLRDELDALRRRGPTCSAGSTHGSASEPRFDAIGVLADMYEGLERHGRAVAEYADRLQIAGLACERMYDGLDR